MNSLRSPLIKITPLNKQTEKQMEQRPRCFEGSSLSRLLLHAKIDEDVEGFISRLMQNEEGKKAIKALLHAAADLGALDRLQAPNSAMEAGLCYLPELQVKTKSCLYTSRATRNNNSNNNATTIAILPNGTSPFRSQMFICRDIEEEQRRGEFVLRLDNIIHLLGSSFIPRRPHSTLKPITTK